MALVSIFEFGGQLRLRRYEGRAQAPTHDGCYAPATVTQANIESYRQWGSPQDRVACSDTGIARRYRGA